MHFHVRATKGKRLLHVSYLEQNKTIIRSFLLSFLPRNDHIWCFARNVPRLISNGARRLDCQISQTNPAGTRKTQNLLLENAPIFASTFPSILYEYSFMVSIYHFSNLFCPCCRILHKLPLSHESYSLPLLKFYAFIPWYIPNKKQWKYCNRSVYVHVKNGFF